MIRLDAGPDGAAPTPYVAEAERVLSLAEVAGRPRWTVAARASGRAMAAGADPTVAQDLDAIARRLWARSRP